MENKIIKNKKQAKIIGTITTVNAKMLEISISKSNKKAICKVSDISDFVNGKLKYFFNVGDEHIFIKKKIQNNKNFLLLDYKTIHPEEIKNKYRLFDTVSSDKNLRKQLIAWMQLYNLNLKGK